MKKTFIIIIILLLLVLSAVVMYQQKKGGFFTKEEEPSVVTIDEQDDTPVVISIPFSPEEASYSLITVEDLKKDPELKNFDKKIDEIDSSFQNFKSSYKAVKKENMDLSEDEVEKLTKKLSDLGTKVTDLKKNVIDASENKFMAVDSIEKVIAYIENEVTQISELDDAICVHCAIEENDTLTYDEKWKNYKKKLSGFDSEFEKMQEKKDDIYAADGIISETLSLFYTIEYGKTGTKRKPMDLKQDLVKQIKNYIEDISKKNNLKIDKMIDTYAQKYINKKAEKQKIIDYLLSYTKEIFTKYDLNKYRYYESEEISFLLYDEIINDFKSNYDLPTVKQDFLKQRNLISLLIYLNFEYHDEVTIGRNMNNDVLTILDLALLL